MSSRPARQGSRGPLCVLKFGGTSVGDAKRIAWVARRSAATSRARQTIVVVSAMAGTTNLLLNSARSAVGRDHSWREASRQIRQRHIETARALLPPAEQSRFAQRLEKSVRVFEDICQGFGLVGEATPRGLDSIASLGELISADLLASTLCASGVPAVAIDAARLILTDDRFGDATVFPEATKARLRRTLFPLLKRGILPVVTGFRGATRSGIPTTLGRGSSDYTATLIGALLRANEVTIWTDVDGVMTADPRLVPGARVIPRLTYAEAVELAFFGAKVIHWKAILPVMESGVPLRVRNSFRPSTSGTLILPGASSRASVTAVTAVPRVHLVAVRADRALGPVELARRVLGWLEPTRAHPLLLLQSSAENSLALAITHEEMPVLANIEQQLSSRAQGHGLVLESSEEVGLVTAVGAQIRHAPGVTARIFAALARRRINVLAVANGPSGHGVALAVEPSALGRSVRAIHREFRL
ncbi:MAG TPA: aspartate kinase [Patescibacteria group bacterium]|nr:aspartate kinase [Patescibacteria group bacterium]